MRSLPLCGNTKEATSMLAQVSAIRSSDGKALNLFTSDTTETPPQPQIRNANEEHHFNLRDGNIKHDHTR